ncbi:MAG: hypothetical protein CFH41_01379 [Alphaproteobacteria bacterium MarineAlpha11_Bin1]|nr:MAG: hypothetical protein CFH41_01379 [Alphaproteobacteria bacterium MarineAlpha11_Bin1]|tara:strand:- start:11878 stop:12780 length:903 start_codon:yes stop_codon:yes gene_type:complete
MNCETLGRKDTVIPNYWTIGPPDSPVAVENADIILPYLPYFLAGWDIRWVGTSIKGGPDLAVEEYADGSLKVVNSGLRPADLSFNNSYDAARSLASELINIYCARDPMATCLRAGAVRIDDGLLVLIEDFGLESSNIALHMAVLGYRFFGDRKIMVLKRGNQVTGTCLGLLPMVRLPLPDDCGDAFREFVHGYSSMQDENMAYLKLWDGEAATFGETAPIKAFVILDHMASGQPVLESTSGSVLIKNAALTTTSTEEISPNFWSGLTLPDSGPNFYNLRFSKSLEAAVLLSQELRTASSI